LRRELVELTARVERTHAELTAQIEALTLDLDLQESSLPPHP